MNAQSLRFDPGGRALAALRFGRAGGTRVLALHGWLDNAMSFAPLAAALPEFDLVALEFAGHGHSAHRPPHTWYHYVDYLDDVACALHALDWQQCVLIGHSLGGAVASAFAAACPERVTRLILIESAGVIAGKAGQAVTTLRTAMQERAAFDHIRTRRVEPQTAVVARMKAGQLSEATARLLIQRNLADDNGRCVWRSDPRLKITSPARFHEDTVREWLHAIECPVLALAADPPFPMVDAATRAERLACLRDVRLQVLPGNHHLHMEDPQPVAAAIRAFLNDTRLIPTRADAAAAS